MAKPFPLQPLLHLAKQKSESAIKNLGKLNQQQNLAQTKLNTLHQFRKDYQEKFQEASKIGMASVDLRNFQDFIYRLDQAIKQQEGVVELMVHSVNAGQVAVIEAQRKMLSFDTLAIRHHQAEHIREAKMEQKIQDEYSGRFAIFRADEKMNEEREGEHYE
jgi:flagellar FliJ protein